MANTVFNITECPRDAMQGIATFIPTELKIEYLNSLLKCGFNRLDFGSFVSPKVIPQMSDTSEVIKHINKSSNTELIAIVANIRGAEDALEFADIDFLGFPFSLSEQFQRKNTNASISESKEKMKHLARMVHDEKRHIMLYLSMGFGNPFGDPYSTQLVIDSALEMYEKFGIQHFALSDTIGIASPQLVKELFLEIKEKVKNIEIGVHLHVEPKNSKEIIQAAYEANCTRFDAAMLGIGGCPMAKNELTGNLATEVLLDWSEENGVNTQIDMDSFQEARKLASNIFSKYH